MRNCFALATLTATCLAAESDPLKMRLKVSMEDYDRSDLTQETLQSPQIFSLQTKRQEILPGREGGGSERGTQKGSGDHPDQACGQDEKKFIKQGI